MLQLIFRLCYNNLFRKYCKLYVSLLVIICIPVVAKFFITNFGALLKFKSNSPRVEFSQKKYLAYNLNTSTSSCGGLGNMLFRIASIYSIGLRLNRQIFFIQENCIQRYKEELAELFHHLHLHINFIEPNPDEYKLMEYAGCCCCYTDPILLKNENVTFLQVNGNYFQSFKFYKDGYKSKVRKLLTFKRAQVDNADKIAGNLFKNDTNHKFCVHTRRGEFYTYQPFYSTKKRTELLLHFALQILKKRFGEISVVMLGKDKNFISTLNIDTTLANKTYLLEETRQERRNEEFTFAIHHCDSLLMTAPSTYAWWISYLMREGSPVFFDRCPSCAHITQKDYFPYEWIPLTFSRGEVHIADTWDGDLRMD